MTEPRNPQHPEEGMAPTSTVQLPTGDPKNPFGTARLDLPGRQPQDVDRTQRIAVPGAPGETTKRPISKGIYYLAGGVTVALAGVFVWFNMGSPARPATAPPAASRAKLPPGVQSYLDQAKAGDAHAMRMLGVMYYYGLNVPQDREEGLRWYRLAAAKGSDAAREELAKLEATGAK